MVRGYAGSYAYAKYGWQDAGYTTACASVVGTKSGAQIPFGHDVKLSAWSRKNNLEALYNLGDNQAKSTVTKAYEGTFSVDFVLGNGYFWRAIFGNTPVTTQVGAVNAWTKTYVDDDAVPSFPVRRHPAPFTTDVGISNGDDDDGGYIYRLIGCLAQSVKLSFNANEPIRVTLEGIYSDELAVPIDGATTVWDPVEDTFCEPISYQNAKIKFPNAAGAEGNITLEVIENSEITISNNAEALVVLGNRKAKVPLAKHMEYTVSISAYLTDVINTDSETPANEETSYDEFIQRFYAQYNATPVTAPLDEGNVDEFEFEIEIVNEYDDGNVNQRKHTIKFEGCSIDSMDEPLDTKEAIKLDMNLIVRKISEITYIDETNTGLAASEYLVEENAAE